MTCDYAHTSVASVHQNVTRAAKKVYFLYWRNGSVPECWQHF